MQILNRSKIGRIAASLSYLYNSSFFFFFNMVLIFLLIISMGTYCSVFLLHNFWQIYLWKYTVVDYVLKNNILTGSTKLYQEIVFLIWKIVLVSAVAELCCAMSLCCPGWNNSSVSETELSTHLSFCVSLYCAVYTSSMQSLFFVNATFSKPATLCWHLLPALPLIVLPLAIWRTSLFSVFCWKHT